MLQEMQLLLHGIDSKQTFRCEQTHCFWYWTGLYATDYWMIMKSQYIHSAPVFDSPLQENAQWSTIGVIIHQLKLVLQQPSRTQRIFSIKNRQTVSQTCPQDEERKNNQEDFMNRGRD